MEKQLFEIVIKKKILAILVFSIIKWCENFIRCVFFYYLEKLNCNMFSKSTFWA